MTKKAYHPDYPPQIVDIDETDFWGRLRVRRDNPYGALLRLAVQQGRSGAIPAAYTALAAYHRQSLQGEFAFYRDGGLPINYHAPQQTVSDLMQHRIWVARGVRRDFGPAKEWSFVRTSQELFGFYWLLPLVEALYRKPLAADQQAVRSIVLHYYQARNTYRWHGPAYHPVYTALSGSISCRHLLPAYVALAAQDALTPDVTEAFLKLFLGIARALHRRETTLVMNNQTVTNCQATALFAAAFPEFREAEAMRKRALERMTQHFDKGFLSDGSYYERSFDYTWVTLHDALSLYQAAQRVKPLPPGVSRQTRQTVRRALTYLEKALGPDTVAPAVGDSQLARFEPLLTELRSFLNQPSKPVRHHQGESHCCRPAGFAFLRNGSDDKDAWLTFNFGRSDLWHSHRDLLNLNFWSGGEPLIEEVGRFGNYAVPLDRVFREPESHNVPVIDGMHYDERFPELWRGEAVKWHSRDGVDYVSARHRVYRRQPTSAAASANWITLRSVVFVKDPGYALVFDAIYPEQGGGSARVAVSQLWHSAWPFRVGAQREAVITGRHGKMLLMPVRTDHLRRIETGVDVASDETPDQPGCQPLERYSLRLRAWCDPNPLGAIGFVTLLLPYGDKRPEIVVRCDPVDSSHIYLAETVSVRIGNRTDMVTINPLGLKNVESRPLFRSEKEL